MTKEKEITRIKDIVYKNYKKEINMTASELDKWSKNPLSKKASLNRKPIFMAIKLNKKPRNRWGMKEIKWALRKAIPYLKRAKKIKGRTKVKGTDYSRKEIALKNWGYDVKKKKKK